MLKKILIICSGYILLCLLAGMLCATVYGYQDKKKSATFDMNDASPPVKPIPSPTPSTDKKANPTTNNTRFADVNNQGHLVMLKNIVLPQSNRYLKNEIISLNKTNGVNGSTYFYIAGTNQVTTIAFITDRAGLQEFCAVLETLIKERDTGIKTLNGALQSTLTLYGDKDLNYVHLGFQGAVFDISIDQARDLLHIANDAAANEY